MDIKIVGLPELEARLNRVIAAIGSLLPEFTEVGKILTEYYGTAPFFSEGNVYGEQWKPLQPAYAAWKERKYPGKGILVRSGTMMGNFRSRPTPMSVTIDNPTSYFAKHQLGKGVPQRVMMQLEETQKKMVIDSISESLKVRIDAAWGMA